MNMNGNENKTALIGHPVAHSKSPLIHNEWLRIYGLDGHYKAIDIAPEALSEGVQTIINAGYKGFNVTIPHKIAIMDLCEEIDDNAKSIGAVNSVTIRDGKLYATNSDAFGFTQNILNAPSAMGKGWSFDGGKAVVLGSGGAARAVIHALLENGTPEIILLNRTREKAENIAKSDARIYVQDWENRNKALDGANLLVNATSLGMTGKAPLEIDLSALSSNALVNDIVYAPLMTKLLEQAKERELGYVTGIGMLLHQARPGFSLWNGVMPEVTPELESKVLQP